MNERDHSAWGVLGLLALPVICCGLPALAAAGVLAGLGGLLGAYGFGLAGAVVLLVAAVFAGRWWMRRRQCELPEAPHDETARR